MKHIILAALLTLSSVCNAEYLVTANWTGNSKPVHTASKRIMLTCEYVYSHTHVWRVFENHCEPLIILGKETLK